MAAFEHNYTCLEATIEYILHYPDCDICDLEGGDGACNKSLGDLFWQTHTEQIFTQAASKCFDASWFELRLRCTFALDQMISLTTFILHANLFWQINASSDPKQQQPWKGFILHARGDFKCTLRLWCCQILFCTLTKILMLSKYSYSVNMIWPKVFHAPCTSLPLIIPHNCCHKMNLKMMMIHCACRAQSTPNCGTWHFILLMHHRTISLIPTHDTSASKGHYMILLPFLPQICQNMFRTLGFEKIWGFAGFSPWTELSLEQGTLESHRGSRFCQWSPEEKKVSV